MQGFLSKYSVRVALSLFLTLLAGAQILGYIGSPLIERIDLFFYDMRMRMQEAAPDARIVIVDIDEKSLARVGRWPWSRDRVADLVTELTERYHARAVSFDMSFAGPDNSSGYRMLEALAGREFNDVPSFGKRVEALRPALDFDRRMAASMQGHPVVLGYELSNEQNAVGKGLLPPPAFTPKDFDGRRLDALSWKTYIGNLAELQQAARAGGFMNPTPDADGVVRRLPLLAQVGDAYYESLALACARVALGANAMLPAFLSQEDGSISAGGPPRYDVLKAIRLDSKPYATTIPVERKITALLQYHGAGGPGGGAFRYVSAIDVLEGRLKPEELADRIVLVGTTAAGLGSLRAAPVGIGFPEVEMHANMIASILDNNFKQQPDFGVGFDLLQTLLLGAALGLVLPMLTPAMAIAFAACAAAVVGAFNFWAYQSLKLVLPLATGLLLIFGLLIVNLAWGYLFEYRKRRAVVDLFGQYVAPEVVREMAADPHSYGMEAQSRHLTALFADVRDFTAIAQRMEPNALREYIRLYLTAMSEDIHGSRGTLDKYIGGAVMAFWGAPVPFPDHASRAVAAALAMQKTALQLNEEFLERDWPELHIGIGLNTGMMQVGDMGSKIRRAYTVVGDAVNLCARLEGLANAYGVGIVVGEATCLAAPEFAYREIDRMRVEGSNDPVPIFEPVAPESELDAEMISAIYQWHDALGLLRSRQWDEAERSVRELQGQNPDDGLYAFYLQRIARFRENPPAADWDGVAGLDGK